MNLSVRSSESDGLNMVDPLDGSQILEEILGPALPQLQMFHVKLAEEGVSKGVIGPRDPGRLWERHILNSAVIVPYVRDCTSNMGIKTVADVGSGGGFPGLVVAACLPDHRITLIEPMSRRVEWLNECVDAMCLRNVEIVRDRAEYVIQQSSQSDHRGQSARYAVVTCRAVAPMRKLAGWTLPLLMSGGKLIALKGQSAEKELEGASKEIRHNGGKNAQVYEAKLGYGLQSTHIVVVTRK